MYQKVGARSSALINSCTSLIDSSAHLYQLKICVLPGKEEDENVSRNICGAGGYFSSGCPAR